MFLLITAIIIVVFIYCLAAYMKEERNIKREFTTKDVIPLETLILFSNAEIADRIKRYYKKGYKTLKFEYADNKYDEIFSGMSKADIRKHLEEIQDFMISKRYEPDDEYQVKDNINKIIFDVWLDYAYKGNYRYFFSQEMYRRLKDGSVSNSAYNEIYRRMRKFSNPD